MKECREKKDGDAHSEEAGGRGRAREGALGEGAGEAAKPRTTETRGDDRAQKLVGSQQWVTGK